VIIFTMMRSIAVATGVVAVAANPTHYGDPKTGCQSDEQPVQVQGVEGDFCSPACTDAGVCPTDEPSGVTANPQCALQTSSGGKYCALICSPSSLTSNGANGECGTGTCQSISGTGICTYAKSANSLKEEPISTVNFARNFHFENHLKKFGKTYGAEELPRRQAIFEKNLAKIIAHNKEYRNGKATWYASVNEFADLTKEEFAVMRGGKKWTPSTHPVVKLESTGTPNPDSVDWRTKNAVTDVKNQGGCGSCWAFSATETVESHYAIASGKLLTLAPQTYVNCVKNPSKCGGTGGCEGATMELAFNLTAQTGIALESDMPYAGRDEECKAYKAAVKVSGYVKNPVNDAAALETAVATKGPQAITVAAEPWQFYGGGVFHGCSSGIFQSKGSDLDHGVQLVGYTKDYWIVRNSWGAGWGEKGFIRISRANDAKTSVDTTPADGVACVPYPKTQTVGGECGILFDTSYPTGVTGVSEVVV